MDSSSISLIIYLFSGLLVIIVLWLVSLEWRLRKIFGGRKGQDLEQILAELGQAVDSVIKKSDHDDKLFEDIYRRLKGTLQRYKTVRFNPFADHGGNQSFALALMDEEGNGVVISSLYSRDKTNVYAKPLVKYVSEYELSAEELAAIAEAKLKR